MRLLPTTALLAALLLGSGPASSSASQPPGLPLPTAAEVAAADAAARTNTAPAARAVAASAVAAKPTVPAPSSRAQVAATVAGTGDALARKGAAAVAARQAAAAAAAAAPPSSAGPIAADPAAPTKSRLHQLQFLGSHRSYHVPLEGKADAFLATADGVAALAAAGRPAGVDAAAAAAAPPSLATQAGALGVRQFHFDAWADPDGGAYARGWAAPKLGGAPGVRPADSLPAWGAPGFKVMADPDFDGRSSCIALGDCLGALVAWSRANPGHSPITVFVSARDTTLLSGASPGAGGAGGVTLDGLLGRMSLTPGPSSLSVPPKIDVDALRALDAEVAAAFGSPGKAVVDEEVAAAGEPGGGGSLLTPDALRVAAGAPPGMPLGRAILARGGGGWPRVAALRGRVMVVLAPGPAGAHAAAYAAAFPNLAGASLFTAAPSAGGAGPDDLFVDLAGGAPGEDAGLSGPAAVSAATSAARRGFLVRARADGPASAAAALLQGGATFVETARPGAGGPDGPALPVPKGVPGRVTASRCNPATSLNPDSAGIAAVGCGQLVADDDGGGAPSAPGGGRGGGGAADGGTVATASLADGDGGDAVAAPTSRADPTANTLIKGVPTVASGFGRRRRLQRAAPAPAISAGGDEEDEDEDEDEGGGVSAKSVTIVEGVPEAGPIPTHKEKPTVVAAAPVAPTRRPADVKAKAAVEAEEDGTVAVTSAAAGPVADPDANTFDGDVYALAIPSLLG